MVFALIVTAIVSLIGTLYGAIQGYFAGWTDIAMERFNEIWSAMPTLYMLIIFSSLFSASFGLLVVLLSVFGWLGIAAYVRAEFLRNRTLDYVRAARARAEQLEDHPAPHPAEQPDARGHAHSLRDGRRDRRAHQPRLPRLGVPPGTPSLGELLNQGKNNLDAWWISLSTFGVLVVTLLLLILIGDALRDALDPRKVLKEDEA